MSQDVDRERVLQTTKVRTTLKSDLSWIQKEKKTANYSKESTEPAEAKLPPGRQFSYVLMTTKKFKPEVSPPPSPKEMTVSENGSGSSSDNGLQNGKHPEPASSESTAESFTTEEKNNVDPHESNESTEGLTIARVNGVTASNDNNDATEVNGVKESVTVNGCSVTAETTKENCENTEMLKVNNTIEECVPNMVPDILAESVFKSPPPQQNGDEQMTNVETVLDILSDSLVEPILIIKTKEDEGNPSSENSHDPAAETPTVNATTEQPATEQTTEETIELPKVLESNTPEGVPPDGSAFTTSAEEDNVESGTSTGEISAVGNNIEPVSAIAEVAKEQDTTAVSSDLPQENNQSPEPQSTSGDIGEAGTASAEVLENNIEPGKSEAEEETIEEPKESDISVLSEVNPELQEPQSTSTKNITKVGTACADVNKTEPEKVEVNEVNIEEPGIAIADVSAAETHEDSMQAAEEPVEEPEASDVSISSDVAQETQSTITVSGITKTEGAAVESNVEPAIVEAPKETAEKPEEPSTKDTTTNADNAAIHGASSEGTPPEPEEEVIVDQNVMQESKIKDADSLESTLSSESLAENVTKCPKEENVVTAERTQNTNVGSSGEETGISEQERVMDATPAEESPEASNTTEALVEGPEEHVEEATVDPIQALPEIDQDETFKAEPAVVVSSPESTTSEAEDANGAAAEAETSGALPKDTEIEAKIEAAQAETEVESTPEVLGGENQSLFDINDALKITPNGEQSTEGGEACKMTDEKVSDEPKDLNEEQQLPGDNSSPDSVEEEETRSASFIMRDGKEVCSHCDLFIGLIKLTVSYPPMYLHPECLKCGVCAKVLGDLLTPMFEHKQLMYCSDCYDKVYSLD